MEEKSQIFSLKSSAVEVEFHKDNSPVEYWRIEFALK